MSSDLITKAKDKVVSTRLQSGQLSFHRYTFLAAVVFIEALSVGKDVSHITLDDFARAFHGTSTKTTRKRSKDQIRRLIPMLIDEGWLLLPDYEGRELSGLIYVRSIPDDDDADIEGMIADRIATAERQFDIKHDRLYQLKETVRSVMTETDEVEPPVE